MRAFAFWKKGQQQQWMLNWGVRITGAQYAYKQDYTCN